MRLRKMQLGKKMNAYTQYFEEYIDKMTFSLTGQTNSVSQIQDMFIKWVSFFNSNMTQTC